MAKKNKKATREWFRTEAWTAKDQDEFFTRLKRAREHKRGQYLRIKAGIIKDKCPNEAIKLLQIVLDEYPERIGIAVTYETIAECYICLKNSEKAIEYFRKTLAFEKEFPNVITAVHFNFPMYVVRNRLTDYYSEALDVLCNLADRYDRYVIFPIHGYRLHAALAIFCDHFKQKEEAKQHAKVALDFAKKEHSGFRYHATLGLVDKPDRRIFEQLKQISKH